MTRPLLTIGARPDQPAAMAAGDADQGRRRTAAAATASAETDRGIGFRGKLLNAFDSPLVGLSPWIVFALVSGPGRLELACVLALALALTIVAVGRLRGGSLKLLELSDLSFFGCLAVVVALASGGTQDWLETWSGEIANVALVVIAAGSIAVRTPFTIQYARERVDPSVWNTPRFQRVNYAISGAWALAFAVQAASGAFGDAVLNDSNNLWTGWIIQIFALILAVQFTVWYPKRTRGLALQRQGLPSEPPPPVRQLFVGMTGWLIVIGILVLVLDSGPTWLGIALIAAGTVTTRQLKRDGDAAHAAAT